jgi:YVTN family beta-propeller protein
MHTRLFLWRISTVTLLVLTSLFATEAFGQTLKQIAKFDLPGPGGKRFDYLTIDEDDHYLLSAHLAADQTYVIDLNTNKVVATITDTPGAEGVEYVPELKKFYTSNAHDNTIGAVDLKQMKVIKKLKTESKPDGSTYAAPFHKLYVSDERGKAEAVD